MTHKPVPVYWNTLTHQQWTLYLAATDHGLCCITLPNETFETMNQWIQKHVHGAVLSHDPIKLEPYQREIVEYLSGQRQTFSCPLDLRGTPFQVQVWQALMQIPFGVVKSYSDVAAQIGHPTAVRAVGTANGANPIPIIVPCHRVIGKNGTLTGYRGGIDIKTALLNLEGLATLPHDDSELHSRRDIVCYTP